MTEIKRGRVPWKRAPVKQPEVADRRPVKTAPTVTKREWTPLVAANAVAFKGNEMTGETLDARKDLPPFGYNPPPKRMLRNKRRRRLVLPRYARPRRTPQHSSAKNVAAFAQPRSRTAVVHQRLLNSNKDVRASFERQTNLKVVRDGRMDGTISAFEPDQSNLGVSQSAMTGAPARDFYALLENMEKSVMAQAAEVWAAHNQVGGGGQGGTFLGMPFGPGMDIFGGADPMGILGSAVGAFSGLSVDQTQQDANGSIDVLSQKVALSVQRMNQMYSVIGSVFSKYNESANQVLNNMKG